MGVKGISDIITCPGLVNVDFADVRSVMTEAGTALLGIGIGSGRSRAIEAAQAAMNSPLLEAARIDGARLRYKYYWWQRHDFRRHDFRI